MSRLKILSVAEQIAKHLREEIMLGRWKDFVPGRNELARELGVNSKTVEAALKLLEIENVLIGQGAGKPRRIASIAEIKKAPTFRVALLLLDMRDKSDHYIMELVHQLEVAGYIPFYSEKSISQFGSDLDRLTHHIKQSEADAWIVVSGSRAILEWFSVYEVPSFALFGRRGGVAIPAVGPDKKSAITAATDKLLELGHRRISLLCREQRRVPRPGLSERAFLRQLEKANIQTSKFNLPDWKESKEGFATLLESLFGLTPPTALIVDEVFLFNATYYYLTSRGLRIPEDVSLICTDNDPGFAWCLPSVAHIEWDYRRVVSRVVRWANNVSQGKKDNKQVLTKAEFVEGDTIAKVNTKAKSKSALI